VRIRSARYLAPVAAGFSAAMRPESMQRYRFPGGAAWSASASGTSSAHQHPGVGAAI